MLAAVPVWALYSVLLMRRPYDLPQAVTLGASIVVALPMLLALLVLRMPAALFEPTLPVLAALGYIAVFASLAGFLLWSFGVARVGPERAGQFLHLIPVFGSLLAALLLGETIALPQICGAACVLAGIALANRSSSRGARK